MKNRVAHMFISTYFFLKFVEKNENTLFLKIPCVKVNPPHKIRDFCFQLNKSTFKKIEENGEKNTPEKGRATIIFSLKNEVGGLVKALKLFQVTQLCVIIKEITVQCEQNIC